MTSTILIGMAIGISLGTIVGNIVWELLQPKEKRDWAVCRFKSMLAPALIANMLAIAWAISILWASWMRPYSWLSPRHALRDFFYLSITERELV